MARHQLCIIIIIIDEEWTYLFTYLLTMRIQDRCNDPSGRKTYWLYVLAEAPTIRNVGSVFNETLS